MRAKLPAHPGVWPTFWLSSAPPGGSPNVEIDVLEFYGDPLGSYMSTVHVWKPGPSFTDVDYVPVYAKP